MADTDSLTELQEAIDAFVEERNWAQFHNPKNLAMGIAIEAAEIMEHFLWCTGDESYSLERQKRAEVANEIGDVLIYLLRLGQVLDMDVIEAARDKLALNREKDPVEKAKGRATKYVDLD
jgi:NTP pyrophosphatase (non-canonical NTP hydrolase)